MTFEGTAGMRGLTLTQPWATEIALGWKRIETRSWRTHYRGLLAIHAARGFPKEARLFAAEERMMGRISRTLALPQSYIVAIANLSECCRTDDLLLQNSLSDMEKRLGDFSPGRWAWMLRDIIALKRPVFCRGALGLWRVSEELESRIRAELP